MFQKSLLLALALFSLQIVAQNSIKFKGKILDEKSKLPLESVTVYVSMAKDSSLVDYTITNKSGIFSFDLKKLSNPVYLKVSMVGFEDHKINLNEISENRDFGIIILKEQAKLLGEIVIKSEAPPIRIKKDTLEFNASSFKVAPDAKVEKLLKQLPGVEIDEEVVKIANSYFKLNEIPNLELVIDDAFEYVLKTKGKYDLIIIDIFQDTTMPNFLFEDFFINRINDLLHTNGFILFNTMVITKKDEERNLVYKNKFGGNYLLRMYPKVEFHNELFTIKKLK